MWIMTTIEAMTGLPSGKSWCSKLAIVSQGHQSVNENSTRKNIVSQEDVVGIFGGPLRSGDDQYAREAEEEFKISTFSGLTMMDQCG